MWVSSLLLVISLAGPLDEEPEFQRASQLFRDLEFEAAIIAFSKAALAPGMSDDDKAVVNIWIGLSYAGLGDEAATRNAFLRALQLDRSATMPAHAAPKMHDLFDEMRRALPPEPELEPEPPPEPERPQQVTPEGTPEPTPAPALPPPTDPSADGGGSGVLLISGLGVAGLGVALVVSGVALGGVGGVIYNESLDLTLTQAEALDRYNTSLALAGVGAAVGGLGLAAVAGGITLAVLGFE